MITRHCSAAETVPECKAPSRRLLGCLTAEAPLVIVSTRAHSVRNARARPGGSRVVGDGHPAPKGRARRAVLSRFHELGQLVQRVTAPAFSISHSRGSCPSAAFLESYRQLLAPDFSQSANGGAARLCGSPGRFTMMRGRGDFCGWRPDAWSPLSVRGGHPSPTRPPHPRTSIRASTAPGSARLAPGRCGVPAPHEPVPLRNPRWASRRRNPELPNAGIPENASWLTRECGHHVLPRVRAACSCLAYAFASTSRTSTLSSVTVSGRIASGP